MSRKTMIVLGAGVAGLVVLAGLWFYFFARDQESRTVVERTEQTREIDFSARIDEFAPLGIQEDDDLLPDHAEEDETDDPEQVQEAFFAQRFVNDLAELIFEKYIPSGSTGNESRIMLSFKQVNMNYAVDLSGFDVDQEDILKARQEVFSYFLQPAVVAMAADYFGPRLLDRILYLCENRTKSIPAAQGVEERLLTEMEQVELFRLFSQRLSYLSRVIGKSASEPQVAMKVKGYLDSVEQLRNVYFEYWQLEETSDRDERERLGTEIKRLIAQREGYREEIITLVASPEMKEAGHDYVYEAQWVYRRTEIDGFSRESIENLAQAGSMVAVMAMDRAEVLLENM